MSNNKWDSIKKTRLTFIISGLFCVIVGILVGINSAVEGEIQGIIISLIVIVIGVGFSLMGHYADKLFKPSENAQILPSAESKKDVSPESLRNGAIGAIYFVAIINIIMGGIVVIYNVKFIRQLGVSYISILMGLVFVGLGFLVHKAYSKMALFVALLLFGIDTLIVIFNALNIITMMINPPPFIKVEPPFGLLAALLMRFYILQIIWRGFKGFSND